MKGLNLSKFKKVAREDKYTLLRDDSGHELRIAHKSLSPKMAQQLDSLPVHLAEGTAIPSEDEEALAGRSYAAPQEPPVQSEPIEAAPATQQPMQSIQQPQNSKPMALQKYIAEDDAWTNDLNNGHVQPDKYRDLFAKKDTLGKIGTIFGLMLGGSGSGVTGQPNIMVQMMDQEIKRDMDAQTKSKENAQNYIRLNQQHLMNEAQISKLQKEGKLTEEQANAVRTENNIKATAFSNMQMNRAALHKLVTDVNKLPQGSPQRVQGEQMLAMLSQQISNENFNIADRAASMGSIANFGVTPGQEKGSEEAFQQSNRALRMSGHENMAVDREAKHFPGIEGQASRALTSKDHDYLSGALNYQRQLDDFVNWAKDHSGSVDPRIIKQGETKAAELQAAYRQATNGGVYKEGEQNFISKFINEKPTRFFNSIRVLPSLKELQSENQKRINQYSKSLGFKGYKHKSEDKPKEEYKIVNGVKYKRGPNGEAIRVK